MFCLRHDSEIRNMVKIFSLSRVLRSGIVGCRYQFQIYSFIYLRRSDKTFLIVALSLRVKHPCQMPPREFLS